MHGTVAFCCLRVAEAWDNLCVCCCCSSFLCVCSEIAVILDIWSTNVEDFVIKSCCHDLVWLTILANSANVTSLLCKRVTHYAAESFSWYSRERLKQAWTPPSFHSRLMTPASSPVMKPSSAEPASTNSCRASSWEESHRCQYHKSTVKVITPPLSLTLICYWADIPVRKF